MSSVHICSLLLQKEVNILTYILVTEANTIKHPVNDGSVNPVSLGGMVAVSAGTVTCGIGGVSPCLPGPWEAGRQ